MGAVSGEEPRPLLEGTLLEVVDAVSEMVSLLLDAGLFLRIRSSIWGSMTSRLMFSQPFWILTLASARRSWRALVICGTQSQHVMSRLMQSWCFRPMLTLDTCALLSTFEATSSGRFSSYCAAMSQNDESSKSDVSLKVEKTDVVSMPDCSVSVSARRIEAQHHRQY